MIRKTRQEIQREYRRKPQKNHQEKGRGEGWVTLGRKIKIQGRHTGERRRMIKREEKGEGHKWRKSEEQGKNGRNDK